MASKGLLQTLPHDDYAAALQFSYEKCQKMAYMAKLKGSRYDSKFPGEQLLRDLDRIGYSVVRYHKLLSIYQEQEANQPTLTVQNAIDEFHPSCKLAVLVANERYLHQYKLCTPEKDCGELGEKLKSLGFIVVILKNVTTDELRESLQTVVDNTPEQCYIVIYLAGHGAEINGIRYFYGVDTPADGLRSSHITSANFILNKAAKVKPRLCVLFMDVCASLIEPNTEFFEATPTLERYNFDDGNMIIVYTSSSDQPAYEQVEISCATDEISKIQYLDTERYKAAVPSNSLYASSLCKHLCDRVAITRILDRVDRDLLNAEKKQTPVLIESGRRKIHLFQSVSGDPETVQQQLKTALSVNEREHYTIL